MTKRDDLSILEREPFKKASSQLRELRDQSRPAFLLGAGCSKCAGIPLSDELTKQILEGDKLGVESKNILETVKKLFESPGNAQIEDYLSELIDFLAIAERREMRNATRKTVQIAGMECNTKQLREAVEQIKQAIASIIEETETSIEIHRDFVAAVDRSVRVGKEREREPVSYLVLNYDTIIEDALALEKISYSDGIDGGVTGWWDPQTFDREGLKARVFKLHGSINWCEIERDPLPRRVNPGLKKGLRTTKNLIWPASTKYRETQLEPFEQLMTRARRAMRPNSRFQRVLIICGYSFRDAHINAEIDRALKESDGHLTIVAFTGENDLIEPLRTWNKDTAFREQVLIFGKRGFFHGKNKESSDEDLPWWKFENIVRILGGER